MTDNESNIDKKKTMLMLVLPGLLATILAGVLGAAGWAAVEYLSSYKEFVKSEIQITDLSEKLKQSNAELQQSKENTLSLKEELYEANRSIKDVTDEFNALSAKNEKLSVINQKYTEQIQIVSELKRKVSILQSDKTALNKLLSSANADNKELQKWIDKHKLTLTKCTNRPANIVNIAKLKYKYYIVYDVATSEIVSFYNGKGWIKVASIGHDGLGNFAMVSSSVFSNPSDLFCIRPEDAFEIDSGRYLVIVSIDHKVGISDNYYTKE